VHTIKTISATEQAEVEDTTTESPLWQESFPANFWQEGKAVKIRGSCVVNDNNSTDTLTLRGRFGADGSTLSNDDAVAASNAVDVADGDVGVLEMTGICTEDPTDSTKWRIVWSGFISDADASDILVNHAVAVATSIAKNVASYFSYSAAWSVAHADNEVAGNSWLVEELV